MSILSLQNSRESFERKREQNHILPARDSTKNVYERWEAESLMREESIFREFIWVAFAMALGWRYFFMRVVNSHTSRKDDDEGWGEREGAVL